MSQPAKHSSQIYDHQRYAFVLLISVLLLGSLAACTGGTPTVPTPTVSLLASPQPLPTALPWQVAGEPITLDNIDQIRLLGRLEVPSETPSSIFSYALSPDNTQLVTMSSLFITGYDLVSGQMTFSTSIQAETRVYYSPDKDEIYTIDDLGGIFVLNSADGGEKTYLNAFPTDTTAAYSGITDYDVNNGWLALGALDGEVKVWDVPQRLAMVTLNGNGQSVTALRFSPDGTQLAVAYADKRVEVWDWRNRTLAYPLEALPAEQNAVFDQLRFSSDGTQLIGMTYSFGVVWDTVSGARKWLLSTGQAAANHVFKVSPTQHLILIGGTGANISLWNTDTGELLSGLGGFGGDLPVDAAFSPDSTLLFTSQLNTDVALWGLQTLAQGTIGRSNAIFENKNVLNLEWTSDGFLILMFDSRGTVDVWGIPQA